MMTDKKAQEVSIALSQNLISFHKGRRASARTPMINSLSFPEHMTVSGELLQPQQQNKLTLYLFILFISFYLNINNKIPFKVAHEAT
jgi:hypothetical protein